MSKKANDSASIESTTKRAYTSKNGGHVVIRFGAKVYLDKAQAKIFADAGMKTGKSIAEELAKDLPPIDPIAIRDATIARVEASIETFKETREIAMLAKQAKAVNKKLKEARAARKARLDENAE